MNRWEEEKVYGNSDEFFIGLLSGIEQAERSVDLEMYIFELDHLGSKILASLAEAAARGVQVRVLVDGVGSPAWGKELLRELEAQKVNARIYRPYPWVKLGAKSIPQILNIRRLGILFRRYNRRNHRKACVIDGKQAWVGSMNVDEKLLRAYGGDEAWRETGVRVRGEAVQVLRFAFERAWMMAWAGRPRSFHIAKSGLLDFDYFWKKNAWVRLNLSFYLRNLYYQDFLDRLHTAMKRIWITSAYFVPAGSILRALRIAARSGVDVRILVSNKTDVRISRWVTGVLLKGLLQAGVRVFEYEPRILHAKTLLIDDWATVGSSNMNHRSLIHDLEVDVVLENKQSLEDLESLFERDSAHSLELLKENCKRGGGIEGLLGRLLFFLRYWL